ncbi:hypothetical protein AB2L27_16850 [Kineococcus sp. LSe6-4]|uniref:Uncharacterized protein n=1 Tax=Kineococcus halophytocola TaxID=3234027 RepID=A0ABV4H4E7_9ACTN
MDPTVLGAIIGAAPATLIGVAAWLASRRSNTNAARTEALANWRWAVGLVASSSAQERAAGWVSLQTIPLDPSLTADDRRMMEATIDRLRTLGGGTP